MKNYYKALNLSVLLVLLVLLRCEVSAAESVQQSDKNTANSAATPSNAASAGNTNTHTITITQGAVTQVMSGSKANKMKDVVTTGKILVEKLNQVQTQGAEGAMMPGVTIQRDSIRTWRIDESGNRVEVQDGSVVIEGPVK
jgi:hypothetical protein